MKWRWLTLLTAAAALVAGLFFFTRLETEFMPSVDRGEFVLMFETVEGASLQATDHAAQRIEKILAQIPEIESFFLAIGLGRTGPGKVNEGISFVRLSHRSQRDRSQQQVMQELRQQVRDLPGVRG